MTTFSEIIEDKIQFFNSAENKIKKGISKLFEEVPELIAISWSQYIPYPSDGDPVDGTPRMEDVRFNFDEEFIDDEIVGLTIRELEDNDKITPKMLELLQTFDDEFNKLLDILVPIFDTNKTITVKRDGTVKKEDFEEDF